VPVDSGGEPGFDQPNNFDSRIGQLDENTRRCLALAFVEGRWHGEIARVTAQPLGSVKSGIRRRAEPPPALPTRADRDLRLLRGTV
jgi:hypothetical protein